MKNGPLSKVPGGITAPKGFVAAGVAAGIKHPSALDLALLVSAREGPIAGVFTTNHCAAAPVLVAKRHFQRGRGRAIVINSGNANACTGTVGLARAERMTQLVADALTIPLHTVFVASTGIIGHPLELSPIKKGLPILQTRLRQSGGTEAAKAILTTDTTVKQAAYRTTIGGQPVTIGGMAKGSGMIHPDMATMLAFLTTDAAIPQPTLQKSLAAAVDQSFTCISVDGDTSTNDMVLCLANGMTGNSVMKPGSPELGLFQTLLNQVCTTLALKVCEDGEGATKLVKIMVTGAKNTASAKHVAKTVGTSNLVKTALFGEDPNWGRIIAAVGRSGVPIDETRLTVTFDTVPIVRKGISLGRANERRVGRVMQRKTYTITVDLGMGNASGYLWTTDLSYEYVRINASYRTEDFSKVR